MRRRGWLFAAAVGAQLVLSGTAAWACSVAGPNGHIGEALSVDPSSGTIRIRDGQSGSPFTFQATREQLSGIRQGDRVLIKFKQTGDALVAEEVTPLR